ETKLFGDHTVEAGAVNSNNIRILGGNLFVYGTVDGKITVVGGDVTLGSTAVVNGTIVAIGGSVQKDDAAVINGKIVETHLKEGLVYREMEPAESIDGESKLVIKDRSIRATESWIHPEKDEFIFNRNEGFVFSLNHTWDGAKKSSVRLNTTLSYRFGSDEPAGRLTLEKSFFSNSNLVFFGSVFKEIRTDDYYRLDEGENTWAGLLGRQDFYDRWDEEGWSAGVGLDLYRVKMKLKLASIKQDSIAVDDHLWSLFNKERDLRPNPEFDVQDQMDYIQATAAFKTKSYSPISTGLKIFVQGEAYQKADDGANIYTLESIQLRKRIFGFVKMNWEMAYGLVFRSQFMAGTSEGRLHEFRKFGVGGLGSVSAFPYKFQIGDQMVQLNGELIFTEDFTDEWFFLKLFVDGGYAWTGSSFNFNQQDFMDYGISSAGIGFGSADEDDLNWSMNIAKPLDGSDYLETTVRLNYNF
ncbi:MAG: hypothetical protein H8E70_05820, partial [Candidatus Marinimicrobia bacterium]|nr:hypothetical protein [Candidatus Neomarinimicrobiota bacterium]